MDFKFDSPVNVTKTFLPPLHEFVSFLEEIWRTGVVTNIGPLALKLENNLQDLLGAQQVYLVNNGTTALQLALRAVGASGEVITTPFSFVATTSSIKWEGYEPRFADICPKTLNLDPKRIEEQITERTSAILATHVYGNPCAVDEIQAIADRHDLAVIYDAAHCFGSQLRGRALATYGDIATLSFHATKIFHTGEGGAIVVNSAKTKDDIRYMRNFGIDGPESFRGVGINGKISEIHCALGLSIWPFLSEIFQTRKLHAQVYDRYFKSEQQLKFPIVPADFEGNGAYYPIIFESEAVVLSVLSDLASVNVFPRRYFYPCLDQLSYVDSKATPIAADISKRVLCLPLAHTMPESTYHRIAERVLKIVKAFPVSSGLSSACDEVST